MSAENVCSRSTRSNLQTLKDIVSASKIQNEMINMIICFIFFSRWSSVEEFFPLGIPQETETNLNIIG